MLSFNIKLKTKNGNEVKKKQSFTVFFKLNYKVNPFSNKTIAEYTYRIMHGDKVYDSRAVMAIKDSKSVSSFEDLTLKVILNMIYLISKVCEEEDITPDLIMFITPDFKGSINRIVVHINKIFNSSKDFNNEDLTRNENFIKGFTESKHIKKIGVKGSDLEMLIEFVKKNPFTKFIAYNPNVDPIRYKKSLYICQQLQDRISRNPELEMTTTEEIDEY